MSHVRSPVFEALIVPHRSLTRAGLAVVLGVLMVGTTAVALRFWLWGAWPVVAFSFIDVPLLVALLAINQRRARASELIMLDSTQLTVTRTDWKGRRKQDSLPAAWLRIDLDATKGIPRVVLSSHGRLCEIGAFLPEPDKMSLFDALRRAIYHAANPRFDNPQLRDEI
ncbi:MAG TPA: DUF2244 domain-containing protein [Rhodopila sp.]|jgi:uncharacterized membrane protein